MAIIDTHKVFENLTDAGFDEAQAKALVGAVSESHDTVATKADLQVVKTDLQAEIANVHAEIQTQEQENKAAFASERTENQAISQEWEAECHAMEMRMTIRLGTMMVIVAGAQTAFFVFLLAHLGVLP